MEHSTGGHYLDTGDGPIPVDPAADAELLAPRPTPQDALSAYHAHQRGCADQCPTGVWRCPDGIRLWNAYLYSTTP